jgi:spore coat protein H
MPSPGELVRAARSVILSTLALLAGLSVVHAAPAKDFQAWPGADLFSTGVTKTLRVTISDSDLERLRQDARTFVPAAVQDDGNHYTNVAVRLKGSVGSFRPLDDKPAFTLDFSADRSGQRFYGLRRIHLNNSVEDPSYCNEQLGSEIFRTAGIPAPRVTRALVFLNNHRLGLYVLKEGFTEDFLSCYFSRIGGNLFEPGEGHDVNQHLKRVSIPAPSQGRGRLKRLGAAALEKDPSKRWADLQAVLDVDRFIRFMALEILLSHRDGYCLARNNFKLYEDVDSGLMIFLPQGMDQLFGVTELTWKPHMVGLVARAVMDSPEGQRRYEDQFKALFKTALDPELLTDRIAQLILPLKPILTSSEFSDVQKRADELKTQIWRRHSFLVSELNTPGPKPLQFSNGVAALGNWAPADAPSEGQMNPSAAKDGRLCLHIQAGSETFASWRTKVWVEPGRYRFEGRAAALGVMGLSSGAHHGAGLRIGGRPRAEEGLLGTSDWRMLKSEFQVNQGGAEVEFICELRASAGEVWFEKDSLRVLKLE